MKWWHWLILELLIIFGVMAWVYFFPSEDIYSDFGKGLIGFVLIYAIEKCRDINRRKTMTSEELDRIAGVQKGAEYGYNKALEEATHNYNAIIADYDKRIAEFTKANEWHYVKDGDLPKDDIKLAIIEIDDCGYLLCNYRNGFWYDANSGATCAEWITNNIIAWKEIVPPSEPNSI